MNRGTFLMVVAAGALWGAILAAERHTGQPTRYVNRQAGFELEVPEGWLVQEASAPALAPLVNAVRSAEGGTTLESLGLVIVVSEQPLGSPLAFNSNLTVSIRQIPPTASPSTSSADELRRLAASVLGDQAGWRFDTSHADPAAIQWIQADSRYERPTSHGESLAITARVAMAIDPSRSRYVLMTGSSLERTFERYQPVFERCVKRFRWLPS